MKKVCKNCGAEVRVINYALGPELLHVDPHASWQSKERGTAWKYCKLSIAEVDD